MNKRFKVWPLGERPRIIIIILILGALQVTLVDAIKIFWLKPDLLLISAVCASLIFKPREGLALSIFAGILKDSLTVSSFGANTLLFSLWSLSLVKLSHNISIEEDYLRLILIFIIAFLHNIIYGLAHIYFQAGAPLGIFLRIVILGSVYTTVAFIPVFRVSTIASLRGLRSSPKQSKRDCFARQWETMARSQ